jgi:hypothetical protein
VLDLDRVVPGSPAAQRLVREAARTVFSTLPEADAVEVRSKRGELLGRVSRKTPMPRAGNLPPELHEPHPHRSHVPDIEPHLREEQLVPVPTRVAPADQGPWPHRPVMDLFDLPETVRGRVRDPEDPADLIRAILEAADVPYQVDGDLITAGDLAIVVARAAGGVTVGHDALNHAYLRVLACGARRGLIVAMGYVDPRQIDRREMAAPQVLHASSDAIQRMADAVVLGSDPLRFAAGIPLASR